MSDHILSINLVAGSEIVNVKSIYVSQRGVAKDIKIQFWEELDEITHIIRHSEKLSKGHDFNGHVGIKGNRYDMTHDNFN